VNINAIKYKIAGQDTKAWRFAPPTGPRKNLLCFAGTADDTQVFHQALVYGLTGQNPHQLIQDVAIYLADNAGHTWVIQRHGDQLKLQRNGTPVDGDIKGTLLATLLDLDVGDERDDSIMDIIRSFDLSVDGDNMLAIPRRPANQKGWGIITIAQERSTQILEKASLFFGANTVVDEKILLSFYRTNEPVYLAWMELQKQKDELAQEIAKAGTHDPQIIHKLENEVSIMERLQQAATPLLDPAQSPQVLKEKMIKVEGELRALCEKHQITTLPMADHAVEWEKIIDVLSRLEALGRMEKATDKAFGQVEDSIVPLFEAYLKEVESVIRHDNQITLELDSCLNNLTQQIREEEPEPEPEEEPSGWMKRIQGFLPILHGEHDDTAGRSRYDSPVKRLEKIRAAVNTVLIRMGELHGNFEDARKMVGDPFANMKERREKLSYEYEKLKKTWEQLCGKYQLPPDINLKTLLALINNLGRIGLLWTERENLQGKILDQKARMQQLPKLIEDWRQNTGSQKETPLDTTAIILSEARGIIQYYDKKKSQLDRMKAMAQQTAGQQFLKSYVQGRQDHLRTEWQRHCQLMALPVLSLESKNWVELFRMAKELESLSVILSESQKPLKNQQIFSERALETPLTAYIWGRSCGTPQNRLKLLQYLEEAPASGLVMLMIDDSDLAEIIKKFGIAWAMDIRAQSPSAASGAQARTVKPQTTGPTKRPGLMSDRAKAALEALQPRPKNPLIR